MDFGLDWKKRHYIDQIFKPKTHEFAIRLVKLFYGSTVNTLMPACYFYYIVLPLIASYLFQST